MPKVYCYETKQEFASYKEAADFFNKDASYISKVMNKPNKSIDKKWHLCSELSIFDGVELSKNNEKSVYCYETKQRFGSISEAEAAFGIKDIGGVIDNPNFTRGDHHWCTSLDIFDGKILKGQKKYVYCYETKQKFQSHEDAADFAETNAGNISRVLNNPNLTANRYHFCTELEIFDNMSISNPNDGIAKPIYCYETKQYFESITQAANIMNLNNMNIRLALNNTNRTSGGYHWCTSLDVFDGVELIYQSSGMSGLEKEVVDYIKLIYNKDIIENNKSIISPQELDIYIPELKLAFEFNGDYWHSDAHKPKNYHIDKTNLCKEKGIQLIHIYEYQWNNNKEVWLSFIANKLKVNPNKFYARKCKIKLVSNEISKEFCDNNHLQGGVNSLINLGLYHNDELISLMTFGKPRFNKDYDYELIRFCNKSFTNVIGGASKLLKYFEVNFKPKSLLSYAEIDYSDGNLYSNLGFELLKVNDPNYVWQKQQIILYRYQTMKHKLENLLSNFDSNLTETENMYNNGYNKIWKCGTYVFVKNY